MKSPITVRAITAPDHAAWLVLWQGYLTFYKESLPDSVTETTWRRILDPGSSIRGIVAEKDGRLVGMAVYVLHPSTWEIQPVCYLEDLFVDPNTRGAGIGKALIDHLIGLCKSEGWPRLYWVTQTHNATARRLYDRYSPADDFVRYLITVEGGGYAMEKAPD